LTANKEQEREVSRFPESKPIAMDLDMTGNELRKVYHYSYFFYFQQQHVA